MGGGEIDLTMCSSQPEIQPAGPESGILPGRECPQACESEVPLHITTYYIWPDLQYEEKLPQCHKELIIFPYGTHRKTLLLP